MLSDRHLFAKLSAGDMVTIDVVYYLACLNRLYRKAATVGRDMTESHASQVIRAYVLDELIDFIEESRGSGE